MKKRNKMVTRAKLIGVGLVVVGILAPTLGIIIAVVGGLVYGVEAAHEWKSEYGDETLARVYSTICFFSMVAGLAGALVERIIR